jgi:SprT protein
LPITSQIAQVIIPVATTDHLVHTLKKYVPEAAVPLCVEWLILHRVHLRITKERSSKLGDYQSPWGGKGHRISVNHNLNPFAFLITFVHEMAHLVAFDKYKRSIAPHGKEWKHEYRLLMMPVFHLQVFPVDIHNALLKYLHNPAAATCSDQHLLRVLKKYDAPHQQQITVEQLAENTVFILRTRNVLVLKKGPLQRTRYQCTELRTNRIYLVNALAEVELPDPSQLNVFANR